MITWDEVRNALYSAVPSTELHLLIERELDQYRTVHDIHREMLSYSEKVGSLPDCTEDMQEDFMGSISGLIGWCRHDQAYRTKVRPEFVSPAPDAIAAHISQQLAPLPVHEQRAILTQLLSNLQATNAAA